MDSKLQIKVHKVEGYEQVIEFIHPEAKLHAIVALHNTTLGPALGGIRVFPYASFDEAMEDVLRLAKGMTYKAAICQSGTGGAKSVIITDTHAPKSEALLKAFGDAINYFKGNYIGAEDIGMKPEDLTVVREQTQYLVGLLHPKSSGDPSFYTAFGGFCGVRAVCQKLWGKPTAKGKKVAIQGLGAVGYKLAESLFWDGADLIVTDVDSALCEELKKRFGAQVVKPDEILSQNCDILVPCARGAILNPKTIPQLKCKAVAGLANNQLLTEEDGDALFERGILYAPDFVINSGGLINVCCEIDKEGYHPSVARDKVARIYDFLLEIFHKAEAEKKATNRVANAIAEQNIATKTGIRKEEIVFHHTL